MTFANLLPVLGEIKKAIEAKIPAYVLFLHVTLGSVSGRIYCVSFHYYAKARISS